MSEKRENPLDLVELEDGEFIESYILIVKISSAVDGNSDLRAYCSDGLGWLERDGMMRNTVKMMDAHDFSGLWDGDEYE